MAGFNIDPRTAALLGAGAGLLSATGPSKRPVSLGQAMGFGAEGMLSAYNQSQAAESQRMYREAQAQELQDKANQRKQVELQKQQLMQVVEKLEPYMPGITLMAQMDPGKAVEVLQQRLYPKQEKLMERDPSKQLVNPYTGEQVSEAVQQGPEWGEPYNDPTGALVQKNIRTGQIKQVVNRPPVTTVTNTVNVAENKYGGKVAELTGEEDVKRYKLVQTSEENVKKLNNLITHLQTSDAITGMGAEVFKDIQRAVNRVTSDAQAGKTVSDTELLDALLGQDVFPMIGALGIGARGLDTPAEREFLRQVMTGTISLNKETLIRMAMLRRDIAARAIEGWNKDMASGALDPFYKGSMKQKQPFAIEPLPELQRAQQPTAPTGRVFDTLPPASKYKNRTVTDTDTGKKYRSDGMRWKEVQ